MSEEDEYVDEDGNVLEGEFILEDGILRRVFPDPSELIPYDDDETETEPYFGDPPSPGAGYVSLWIGVAESEERLLEVLEPNYVDGGPYDSDFFLAYPTMYDDPVQFAPIWYGRSTRSLRALLSRAQLPKTDEHRLVRAIGDRVPASNFVLIGFDVKYKAARRSWSTKGLKSRFLKSMRMKST